MLRTSAARIASSIMWSLSIRSNSAPVTSAPPIRARPRAAASRFHEDLSSSSFRSFVFASGVPSRASCSAVLLFSSVKVAPSTAL